LGNYSKNVFSHNQDIYLNFLNNQPIAIFEKGEKYPTLIITILHENIEILIDYQITNYNP
jgi:hypothetical protein